MRTFGEDNRFEWDPTAVELMHNYSTSTCFTFSDDPVLQNFYQLDIPKIGFSHEHVLHLLLSLSALHLARFRPSTRSLCLEHADRHYQAGLRITTALLQNITQGNCHSIFLFTSMCNSYTLAKGPVPGNFLLFDDAGQAEWMSLFRGIKPVMELHGEDIQRGVLSPMIKVGTTAVHGS